MYAIKHKPTKTWVYFRPKVICLAGTSADATISDSKEILLEKLKEASFNGIENYGRDNFLEFQVKRIKYDNTTIDTHFK
jgi:hypothetical protein